MSAEVRTPIFIVEGEIAAGKTALVLSLAESLRARGFKVGVALEPVDQWEKCGILKKFYDDRQRWAYSFQTFVYSTRTLAILECLDKNPDVDLYLLERSPATDTVFMELQRGEVDPVEMIMYKSWCDIHARALPVDLGRAHVLYLKTGLDCCMQRLARRKRNGEIGGPGGEESTEGGGVSIEYQVELRRAHEAFLLGMHPGEFPGLGPCPFRQVTVVPPELADSDFRRGGADHDSTVNAILGLMGY